MKATGIVRRIDELGRVVIPKEIRRTLRIREGDPLEIFTDREGEVILKKYSPIGELSDFAKEYSEALHQAVNHTAVICDKDNIIAVSGGSKRELLEKQLSVAVEELMQKREKLLLNDPEGISTPAVVQGDGGDGFTSVAIVPILAAGDTIGAVMLLSRDKDAAMGTVELKLCETAAQFMGKQMEN